MSSFVDQPFRSIGQHTRNATDSSSGNLCGGVSKRRDHDDMEQQLEVEPGEEEERGMRRPVDLDLGFRSKLENPSMGGGTIRQVSFTSDLDLTPSAELSPWHDLHLAVEDREWTEERRTKQWNDPPLRSVVFHDANNPSLEANLYESRNKRTADGVRGGLGRGGRREGRDNDAAGSDSDSGKGTVVSDCRQSPTEEISFRGSLIEETLKQSLCDDDDELEKTTSVNVKVDASQASSIEHGKSERTPDDDSDYLVGVTYLQRITDSEPTPHHYSHHDCYPVLPDSSLGVAHPERLSKVERYLSTGSPGEEQRQNNRFCEDKGFSGDVRVHGVIDSNNNNSFEFSTPSKVDNPRCHDAVTPLRHARRLDMSPEFKGTPNRTMRCAADNDVVDAGHDLVSSSRRREFQAKCKDMYGSKPSILGSQDIHGRFGSRQNVHDSRHDMNGSHCDVYPRHESQIICHDTYNSNRDEIKSSHYDTEYDSRYDINGGYAAGSSGQVYHSRGRDVHAESQNNAHAMRGSRDAFPARHEFTHASHDSVHDSRLQSGIGYNRCPSLTDSPSKISADYSFGNVQGNLNSTPGGRRYYRRESPAPSSGFGTPCYHTPQKGHRYTRKSTADGSFAHTASESDPEIYHEEMDKSFPGASSHINITPAQYRRIRSVPHDRTPTAGPRGLGSIHPALQQPFSDEEPVTLPRPAKPGRSAAARSAAEQQASSCGKTEVKGHRQRPNRRWTNLGLSSGEPEVEEFKGKTKTPGNQSGFRFRVPSLFRSKKDLTSTASPGTTGSGTTPETGTPVIMAGSRDGNGARIRGDSETGSKVRSRSGTAVESGFDTGSSLGSAGDISIWSMSLGSTQSVFDTRESPVPVQGADPGNDNFRRSVSVPDPDGRGRSSVSILDRLRARLLPSRKKSVSSSKDGLNRNDDQRTSSLPSTNGPTNKQSREEIQLTVLPLFNSPVTDRASRGQMDGDDDEADRCGESSMATVAMTTNFSMTTTFVPSTPTKSEESSAIRKVSFMDTNASTASSPSTASSSTFAAAAVPHTSSTRDCFQSKTRDGRVTLKRAPPSEECFSAVSEIIDSLAGLTDFVDSSITSAPNTERTITEVEFREYRSLMIDAVKQFNQACKQMVIKTPESEPAFLEALHSCRYSLDDIANKYCALVDCASLPADRSKVAIQVIAVANSLRETVTVAFRVTGCSARDPAMLSLRRSANRLVSDLGLLMRSVREMNYNRLSRRF